MLTIHHNLFRLLQFPYIRMIVKFYQPNASSNKYTFVNRADASITA